MERKKKCVICGQVFIKNPDFSIERWKNQRCCSRVCGLKSRKGEKRKARGPYHPYWKGGRRVSKAGYTLVCRPLHPYCQSHGYILEHRLVMEAHIGRYLHPKEIVHHVNGVKTDNRIENLKLLGSQSEHARAHFKQDPITGRLIA